MGYKPQDEGFCRAGECLRKSTPDLFDKPKAGGAIMEKEAIACPICNYMMHRMYRGNGTALFRCQLCGSIQLFVEGKMVYTYKGKELK